MKIERLNSTILFKNVNLLNADPVKSLQNGCVLVRDGKLENIAPLIEGNFDEIIDCDGLMLMPSGVDPQVHLRVPGQLQKETPECGLKAALKGGYGAVLSMPNTAPVIDSPDVLKRAFEEIRSAQAETGVKVLFSSAVTKGLKGVENVDFDAMVGAGIQFFTDDGLGVASDENMRSAFEASGRLGFTFLQHAEFLGHGGVLAEGPVQKKLGINAYPSSAEWEMVKRDISLLKHYPKAKYHVLHVSCVETIELIQDAQNQGLFVTGEASPHHLFFSSNDVVEKNMSFKMNPPLRSDRDRKALRNALKEGILSFVATDHAPHEQTAKGSRFEASAFGTTGLETALPVLTTIALEENWNFGFVVSVFSKNPSAFLGISDEIGELSEGRPFHAVLLDPNAEWEVGETDLESLSKNNCFLGQKLFGKVKMVFQPNHKVVMN